MPPRAYRSIGKFADKLNQMSEESVFQRDRFSGAAECLNLVPEDTDLGRKRTEQAVMAKTLKYVARFIREGVKRQKSNVE